MRNFTKVFRFSLEETENPQSSLTLDISMRRGQCKNIAVRGLFGHLLPDAIRVRARARERKRGNLFPYSCLDFHDCRLNPLALTYAPKCMPTVSRRSFVAAHALPIDLNPPPSPHGNFSLSFSSLSQVDIFRGDAFRLRGLVIPR